MWRLNDITIWRDFFQKVIFKSKNLKKKSQVINWSKRGQEIIKSNYLHHVSDKGKSHQTFLNLAIKPFDPPHYYLPPQIFRLCCIPEMHFFHRIAASKWLLRLFYVKIGHRKIWKTTIAIIFWICCIQTFSLSAN